jgi:hypothetical protein
MSKASSKAHQQVAQASNAGPEKWTTLPRFSGSIMAVLAVAWTALTVGAGFGFKAFVDFQQKAAEVRDERVLSFAAEQLREFWWPVYFRLQIDSAIWIPIASNIPSRTLAPFKADLVDKLLIPNHDEIVKIIETKFHLAAQAAPELQQWFVEYVNHVAIYHAIRHAAGTNPELADHTPFNYERPFPGEPNEQRTCPYGIILTDKISNCFVAGVGRTVLRLQEQYNRDVETALSRFLSK